MESKDGIPLVCLYVYICYIYIYDYLIVSSPYLLVFGDRVRSTQEQMMLQVDLMRHRVRAGLVWEKRVF